jgi:hypothetical protein
MSMLNTLLVFLQVLSAPSFIFQLIRVQLVVTPDMVDKGPKTKDLSSFHKLVNLSGLSIREPGQVPRCRGSQSNVFFLTMCF